MKKTIFMWLTALQTDKELQRKKQYFTLVWGRAKWPRKFTEKFTQNFGKKELFPWTYPEK